MRSTAKAQVKVFESLNPMDSVRITVEKERLVRIKGRSHFVEETRKHRIAAISRDQAKPSLENPPRKQDTPL